MNVRKTVEEQLKQLDQVAKDDACEQAIQLKDERVELTCQLTALDAIGCAFETIDLRGERLISADAKLMQRIGKQLSERLNYLMEPIEPIEFDEHVCILQLRSCPPSQDDDTRAYFELAVRDDGTISLARYEKANGEQRRNVPANLTREMLVRLICDLCEVAA